MSRRTVGPRRRTGAILVAVLTCILVAVALVGGAMKSTLTARRQCKLELQKQQAELLLQAGMERLNSADSKIASTIVTAQVANWDARAALPEFEIAEVSYEKKTADNATTLIVHCTARLGITSSPEHVIHLSRDLIIENKPN